MIYQNGYFYAGTTREFPNSRVQKSADGVNWTSIDLPVTGAVLKLASGNGRIFAHQVRQVATSADDGATWFFAMIQNDNVLNLVHGNGLFVGVTQNGCVVGTADTDGLTWTSFQLNGLPVFRGDLRRRPLRGGR